MKIGFVGPIDTILLTQTMGLNANSLPRAYSIPMNSYLVSAFLAEGHEVAVFGLSKDISQPTTWDFGALKVHLGRYRDHHRARDFFKLERADLRSALKRNPCDILNAHWTYEFALAALSVDKDALISVRDWAPSILGQMPDPYRLVRFLMSAAVYIKGVHYTVNSPYVNQLIERWSFNFAELIPNGIPNESFNKSATWKPVDEVRSVVAINRGFFYRKNIPTLLRAFAKVRFELPNLRLKLIGFGSEVGSEGHRWAIRKKLDKKVDFLGDMAYQETQDHLSEASLLVHPSHEESFGMVLIEAMAKGIPVIGGARSGAVPWVLNEGQAGLLVDVADPDSIAVAINSVLSDESTWQRFSNAGYDYSSDNFRMSVVAARYIKQYEKIISLKSQPFRAV
jgi:glycosyltransferase involved in cell wall biosynthesis